MSAKMIGSSAPGTPNSVLSGMIIPAMHWRSRNSAADRLASLSLCMSSSIEQGSQALLHGIGDIKRQSLDGTGRIHAAGGDEDAAIDDEQVLHIMTSAPAVHHRPFRVGPHAGRAEQVPAAIHNRAVHTDIGGARRLKYFLRARSAVVHHAPGVLAYRVVDPGRGDAMAVLQDGIERHPIMLLRQVFADCGQPDAPTDQLAEDTMMVLAPGQAAVGIAEDRLGDGSNAAAELVGVAADEIAFGIGLVEFHAPQAKRRRSIAVEWFLHIAKNLGIGMEHQVLAD